MTQEIFTTVSFREFEHNIKSWLREVLVEINSEENRKADIPELLSCQQAAEYLNISKKTLYNWHKQGKLCPKKIGRKILYNKEQIALALKNIDRLRYSNITNQ